MGAKSASAPGKIILSGEYAVLFDYPAIAVPAPLRVAMRYNPEPKDSLIIDWEGPANWQAYVRDIAAQCGATHGTLRINNDLPLGKGMGSSTAFVIAICRCLLGTDCKDRARQIEDQLNPGHSGLDFTVIWHEQPVLYSKNAGTTLLDTDYQLTGMHLVDTGTPDQQTPELVAWVQDREPELTSALQTIGQCTERLLSDTPLEEIIPDHHRAQVALGVVPERAQELIKKIEQKDGVAKVIGAGSRTGGSGMVLALGKLTIEEMATLTRSTL